MNSSFRPDTQHASLALDEIAQSLPVELTVEISRQITDLGTLQAFAPEYILHLKLPARPQATLRANDKVIAQGELIDIDGELCLRLTKITSSNPSNPLQEG